MCWIWGRDAQGLIHGLGFRHEHCRLKIAYHGTPHIERVLEEGIKGEFSDCSCKCIWLAKKPEDAAVFGEVIEVNMTGIPGDIPDGEWQGTFPHGYIEPQRLKRWIDNQAARIDNKTTSVDTVGSKSEILL